VASALPEKLRPQPSVTKLFRKEAMDGTLVLRGTTLHMLPETHEDISATQIRAAVDRGAALKRLLPDLVAEYIKKEGLYRAGKRKA
jgi:nicotinic acid mononucleotide adenylyltransferase